jgi:D-tyrosyl-tRNA(Tyr) deacylase
MRVVLQRVKQSKVTVDGKVVGRTNKGLLIFLGVGKDDTREAADMLAQKIPQLRVFDDDAGKMNVSSQEANASFLVVSQFTLYGDCRKGRRPSFDQAAEPTKAEELYDYFVSKLKEQNVKVETGQFRAMMDVELVNDGPVTFVIDSSQLSAISSQLKADG